MPMKVLNGLVFAITLLLGVLTWGLYTFEPGLLLGTPWGTLHVSFLLAGSFVLGAAVTGLYGLLNWVNYQAQNSRRSRELRQARGELEALRKQHPQELPIIPDREQP